MSGHPHYITEDHVRGAKAVQDAAPDIIMAAQIALLARGVTDAYEVFAALLGAAWHHHKEMHGLDRHAAFAEMLRDMAASVERAAKPH